MKFWQLAVVVTAALAVTGCRTDPRIAMVERENRLLEDEIYRLQECISNYRMGVESAPAADTDRPPATKRRSAPATATGPALGDAPLHEAEDIPQVTVPETPTPVDEALEKLRVPEGQTPGRDRSMPKDEAPRWTPPDSSPPEPAFPRPQEGSDTNSSPQTADSGQVSRLVVNRPLTGGCDTDGRPGDDGIRLSIEPRNGRGQVVAAPAELVVVVLDPALPGEDARVARWDLTAEELARRSHGGGSGRGIDLRLPWPAAPPVHDRLHLFVRYVTADGQNLEASEPIEVDISGKGPPRRISDEGSPGWVRAEPTAAEPGFRAAPGVRVQAAPHYSTATRPAAPASRRPVWSPFRR